MRIAIDGNLLTGKKTGMGTVVYSVLTCWKATKQKKVILYVKEKLDIGFETILKENGIIVKVLGQSNYFKWEQTVIPKAVKRDKIDILWCPYNTAPIMASCKTVVSIHDVIYMDAPLRSAPSMYKKLGIIYRKHIVPIAAKKAKQIITGSEFARMEIIRFFPIWKRKINVVLNGADISAVCLSEADKTSFFRSKGIKSPYILGFGSLEARKNSLRLISSYDKMPQKIRDTYQLVLFGFRGYEESEDYEFIRKHHLEDRVVVLGYVSDQQKTTLYQKSELFVFPTLSEGFGIPVLEAFAAETPVITSNVTSLPEVAGDAAVLVNPKRKDEIIHAIKIVLSDKNKKEKMIAAGKEQLSKFSWEKTADAIWKIIVNEE